MTDAPLQGVGVLVTRPRVQASGLIEAIQSNGGNAICFPVIEIVPRDETAVANDAAELPAADIVIYVSRNAVAYGLQYAAGATTGATGPATAAAIQAAGQTVDFKPDDGFDSESLLEEPVLKDVAGKQIQIIHGGDGRELLAETLRERGARVDYLPVYERRIPDSSPELLAEVESAWRNGKINAVTIMSVETLENLCALLPGWCVQQLSSMPLVTPAARVIKEVLDRYPAAKTILASGPQAADMVQAIISIHSTQPGLAP